MKIALSMNDVITIIIPVHVFDDVVKKCLPRAVESVDEDLNILIVTPSKNIEGDVKKLITSENVNTTVCGDGSSFQTLVNFGVNSINTPWFSILEFDDTYTNIFYKNAYEYISNFPNVSMFIPFEDIYNYNEDKFVGSVNEAPWASSFSEEIGYLDYDALQSFYDFYLTGSIFNTEDWKEVGGLKSNIKLTFWYEFMLRLTNKDKKIYVIPKIMYNHYLNRDGSLVSDYMKNIGEKESKFWFNTAKKEYFYTMQREVSYEETDDSSNKE